MGYALRSDEHYAGLRPGGGWAYDLMSDWRFRKPVTARTRREKMQIDVVVAGQPIRLESNEAQLPSPVVESLSRLSDLAEFEANWNSYGALPLQTSVVEPAIRLILATFPQCMQPEISLTTTGGISLFWCRDAKEFEVEVRPDGSFDYAFEDQATGEEKTPDQPASFADVQEFLGEILR